MAQSLSYFRFMGTVSIFDDSIFSKTVPSVDSLSPQIVSGIALFRFRQEMQRRITLALGSPRYALPQSCFLIQGVILDRASLTHDSTCACVERSKGPVGIVALPNDHVAVFHS